MNSHRKPSDLIPKMACCLPNWMTFQTNFAKWEPWHGKFGLYYPWGEYLQLGDHLRELASSIISLTSCLQSPKQELHQRKYLQHLVTCSK
ncbi:hypothetical protein G4B88_013116 [Cannabis sativa]|uniref:Uncharacterized protein n=1 Tax=Cannabis sativa TaxID=3483 RepID=A0A7J6I475_CANSA|nr:hypothetical protein G4B88_013116 [Cannabis sativa]